jgi:Domain of unknown function (DUF4375)
MSGEMPYESDPITMKLNELVASQELYMGLMAFDELKPAEQALIGTWELANEVYNGGFMQYFHNSSREHAKPMVDVLRSIDARQAADILESAIALAGPGTTLGDEPNYLAAVNSMPDDVERQITELERKFYDELDNLHLRLFRYLSKHRDQIEAPEEFWTEATIQ